MATIVYMSRTGNGDHQSDGMPDPSVSDQTIQTARREARRLKRTHIVLIHDSEGWSRVFPGGRWVDLSDSEARSYGLVTNPRGRR
jgi:hypothetical protein